MSYLVLARRWRPQTFAEVVGQEHVTRTLRNALISGRVAQAFLFSGTRGVGKTSAARILAKALNCLGPAEEAPCNRCASCVEINDGRAVDVQEIDGASNNSVDQIRELRENVLYLPARARRKVYIIDEVHMLSRGAFNALLKTLEEPPEHVVFIFATTEVHKVPATILSRCQRFDFRPIPPGLVASQLQAVMAQEGLTLEPEAATLLARSAKGSLRDGLSLLDQALSFSGDRVTQADAHQVLGLVDPKLVRDLAGAILAADNPQILAGVAEVVQHGFDLRTFFQEVLAHFRNLIVLKVDPQAGAESLGLSPAETAELQAQADQATAQSLQLCLHSLLESERLLKTTTQPRFALELALLKVAQMLPVVGLDEILVKLDHLKDQLGSLPLAGGSKAPSPGLAPTPVLSGGETDEEPDDEAGPVPADAPRPGQRDPLQAWPDFLAALKANHPRLTAFLEQTRPTQADKGQLVLVSDTAFDFLADQARREQMEAQVAKFFGRPWRLKLAPSSAKNKKINDVQKVNNVRQEALNHPRVREAVQLFDGQPVEVKVLGSGGEGQ